MGFLSVEDAKARVAALSPKVIKTELKDCSVRWDLGRKQPYLVCGKDQFSFTRTGLKDLRAWTRIDSKTADAIADNEQLFAQVMDHLLKKYTSPVTMEVRNASVYGIFHGSVPRISPVRLFELITEANVEGITVDRVADIRLHDPSVLEFRCVTNMASEPPTHKGDISYGGIWGQINHNVELGAYVHRMVCSNGMMGDHREVRMVAASTDEELESRVLLEAQSAYLTMRDTFLPNFVHSAEVPVPDPAAFLARLGREWGLSGAAVSELIDELPRLPEAATVYDIVNLVTQTAQAAKSLRTSSSLEWFGGHMVQLVPELSHRCTRCMRPVAGA